MTITMTLKQGNQGGQVKEWQAFLIKMGFLPPGQADGIFGAKTDDATRKYQAARGLVADGIVGAHTLAKAQADGLGAVTNFYRDVIVNDSRFGSTDRITDLNLLEPVTRKKVESIIADAGAQGVELMVVETYRSKQRQEQLFNQGASMLKDVGVHHYGLACDLVRVINGKADFGANLSLLGQLAQKYRLVWGGAWTDIHDPYHVQRCSVSRQKSLFGGQWYPDDVYDALSS